MKSLKLYSYIVSRSICEFFALFEVVVAGGAAVAAAVHLDGCSMYCMLVLFVHACVFIQSLNESVRQDCLGGRKCCQSNTKQPPTTHLLVLAHPSPPLIERIQRRTTYYPCSTWKKLLAITVLVSPLHC